MRDLWLACRVHCLRESTRLMLRRKVDATMMTKERAKQIQLALQSVRVPSDGGGATKEEDAEIKAFWDKCPGNWSYYHAVAAMAQGAHQRA